MGDYEMNSPYFGQPSPNVDRTWLELLQCTVSVAFLNRQYWYGYRLCHSHHQRRICAIQQRRDLARRWFWIPLYLNDVSRSTLRGKLIPVNGKRLYLTMLQRYLYQLLYPEYYFPNQTEAEHIARRDHGGIYPTKIWHAQSNLVVEHCLMNLKHAITCSGDITVRTMQWDPKQLLPVATDNAHECANWDSINQWMKSRSVDAYKPGMLVHPILGKFYLTAASRTGFEHWYYSPRTFISERVSRRCKISLGSLGNSISCLHLL